MTLQANDRVVHSTVEQEMTIKGLGEENGIPLAWCEWIDANRHQQRKAFPEAELIKRH